MVAHRSPKPPVRVRVLLPLPQWKPDCATVLWFLFFYKKLIFLFNKKGTINFTVPPSNF